jgi:hypothetical protein
MMEEVCTSETKKGINKQKDSKGLEEKVVYACTSVLILIVMLSGNLQSVKWVMKKVPVGM